MAMARQQELMSDESPKEAQNDDEQPQRSESKRKKFRPFRAVRNMFRKRMRRQGSENLQDYKKSRSTTELQNEEDSGRRLSSPNSPYSVGLSVSHDSIFSPDHAAASLDPQELRNIHGFLSVQHVELKDLKDELFARIRARRDSDDEDAGLPRSPCTSPTTADILSQNLKSKSGISRTTCSEGSLISMGSSENDEDLMGMVLSSHSSRMSLLDKRFQDSDEADVSQPVPLSHKAAHHKIAVRPKRTHGLPRHRKQQLAASRLGSLPSTPEISEDSGKPSSGSLHSSEIYLSETENTGTNHQSAVSSSLDFAKKLDSPGDSTVGDSMTNISPVSPSEHPVKSPKCTFFSSPETSPNWDANEMSESTGSIEGKATSNEENKGPGTPSNDNKINKDSSKKIDISDSPEDRSEKEANVFSAWGAKVRKTDLDRQEKVSKNDHDEEPFLSRWFGSRRSNRANKRNTNECSSPPKDETKLQEKQTSLEADTNCSDKNEKKIKKENVVEKKNLFLNLEAESMHNGTGWRNFIQSHSDSPKEKISQSLIGQSQLENFSNKQVVKSSSDDSVHYSLNARKPQDSKTSSQGLKPKAAEKHQEGDMETKPASTLTTWADLKKAQNLKQDTASSYHKESSEMGCKETQKTMSFNSQLTDKVPQCERPSSLDITKKAFDFENYIEASNSCHHWKQNLKNLSNNCKQDILNGTNEKDVFTTSCDVERPSKSVESPILNRLRTEAKETLEKNKEPNKSESKSRDNENKLSKPNMGHFAHSTAEKMPKSHSLDNGFDHPADTIKEQSHFRNMTSSSSKLSDACNSNNIPSRYKLRSTNSISKADIIKAHSMNDGNMSVISKSPEGNKRSSPDSKFCNGKKDTDMETVQPSLMEQNKNGGKISPRQSEEVSNKDRNEKDFEPESSLPPNSELFRVFARRSIKQKNSDKDKQNKTAETTASKHNNGQEASNLESKCVQKTPSKDKATHKDIRDKVTDKDNSEVVVQTEKVGAVQEIFIPRPRIVPPSTQLKESSNEKRTQRNNSNETIQEIHIPRPRSHTTSEPSQSNDSMPEMRTRKCSVPESSKQALVKSKEEPCEEVKSGRVVNDRDKSKSFKLSNTRNSPPDTRCADDNIQPSWLRLAQQRREQREQKEKQLLGSSSPQTSETISKPARSTKVLDMVSNFQKLQMT